MALTTNVDFDELDRSWPCTLTAGKQYTRDGCCQQVWPDGDVWKSHHVHTDGTRCNLVRDTNDQPWRLDPTRVRLPFEI